MLKSVTQGGIARQYSVANIVKLVEDERFDEFCFNGSKDEVGLSDLEKWDTTNEIK